MHTTLTTLCYLERDDKYLMLHRVKKQADVNQGKWIGVGGKLEQGESPEECLIREVREETGFTLTGFRYRGLITFIYADKEPEYIFTYTSKEFCIPETAADENAESSREDAVCKSNMTNKSNAADKSKAADKSNVTGRTHSADDATALQMEKTGTEGDCLPVPECDEGIFAWVEKEKILTDLELWEGDRYMLNYLLKDRKEPFSLKLCYDSNDRLIDARETGIFVDAYFPQW